MEILKKYEDFLIAFDAMNHETSFTLGLTILKSIKLESTISPENLAVLYNLAGHFIDIGQEDSNISAIEIGIEILEEYKELFCKNFENAQYFYNLANGKSHLIDISPFDQDFNTIESLVDIKNLYWRAINSQFTQNGQVQPEFWVNLGNSLKTQSRVIEALDCYKKAILINSDIPQAWVNQSDGLKILNIISETFSIAMLRKIQLGYENSIKSPQIPEIWRENFRKQIDITNDIIRKHITDDPSLTEEDHHTDENITLKEFNNLSKYRQFSIKNNLCLSMHSLYCQCIGSISDDLSIVSRNGIHGDFIIPMELVLNRLKSEFSLARLMYYEYITDKKTESTLEDSYFSDLLNDEVIGIEIEKARTAFRLCFGILDKIGQAICDLFNVHPEKGMIYFDNFWQLDNKNRREKFNKIKSFGLLALYSISTDLNDKKNGELAFYKKLRNHLEHQFVVVHKEENSSDIYQSLSHKNRKILLISEKEFMFNLEQMLKITRSSIFYFVFTIQDYARKNTGDSTFYQQIQINPIK